MDGPIIELFNPAHTQLFGDVDDDMLTHEARAVTAYEADGLIP